MRWMDVRVPEALHITPYASAFLHRAYRGVQCQCEEVPREAKVVWVLTRKCF